MLVFFYCIYARRWTQYVGMTLVSISCPVQMTSIWLLQIRLMERCVTALYSLHFYEDYITLFAFVKWCCVNRMYTKYIYHWYLAISSASSLCLHRWRCLSVLHIEQISFVLGFYRQQMIFRFVHFIFNYKE